MKIKCRRSVGCLRKDKTFATPVEYARHLVKVHKDRPSEAAMAAAEELEPKRERSIMKLQGTEKPIAVNIRIIVEAAQTLKTLNHDESRNRVELAHVARIIRQAADEINTMAKVRAERRLQDLTVLRP